MKNEVTDKELDELERDADECINNSEDVSSGFALSVIIRLLWLILKSLLRKD